MLLMTVGIKDTPGQYLNLGQILPTKKKAYSNVSHVCCDKTEENS